MKNIWVTATLGLLVSMQLSAQVVSKDSIGSLKYQREALQISKDLNERKIKLAKLENELSEKSEMVDKTTQKAQESADDNGTAAEKLTNDAQDKKKANKAHDTAVNAQRDAKKARKVSNNLESLIKDIESLKTAIAGDEKSWLQYRVIRFKTKISYFRHYNYLMYNN